MSYKSFIGEMYLEKQDYFMACISVPWPGTNGIHCEALGFVYIQFEVRVNAV
jgi:hypothetical protein